MSKPLLEPLLIILKKLLRGEKKTTTRPKICNAVLLIIIRIWKHNRSAIWRHCLDFYKPVNIIINNTTHGTPRSRGSRLQNAFYIPMTRV